MARCKKVFIVESVCVCVRFSLGVFVERKIGGLCSTPAAFYCSQASVLPYRSIRLLVCAARRPADPLHSDTLKKRKMFPRGSGLGLFYIFIHLRYRVFYYYFQLIY